MVARTAFRRAIIDPAKGFSLAVIGTLALCLGPNTAIFSVLYSLVLKPLPFAESSRMVMISNISNDSGADYAASLTQFEDYRTNADLFEDFAMVGGGNMTLETDDRPTIRVEAHPVTVSFFDFLRLHPLQGRFFGSDDAIPGNGDVVVITEELWRAEFDGSPNAIGREIRLNDRPLSIIGVAPRETDALMRGADFFYPYTSTPADVSPDARYAFRGVLFGRLKPGVARGEGQAQLETMEARFRELDAGPRARSFLKRTGLRIELSPAANFTAGWVSRQLWMLEAGALLVLLIAGVNVMNLFLARSSARAPEFAVRIALGAGRAALLRQVIAESLILVGCAVIVGLGLSLAGLALFNWYLPIVAHTLPHLTLNPAAVGWVCAAATALALLAGWMPFALVGRFSWRRDAASATPHPEPSLERFHKYCGRLHTTLVATSLFETF